MAKRDSQDIKSSEITPESSFLNRRRLVQGAGLLGVGAGATALLSTRAGASSNTTGAVPTASAQTQGAATPMPVTGSGFTLEEALTPEDIVTNYNNFYEFGTGKEDPAAYAHEMTIDPWQVRVTGAAEKTGKFDLADLIKGLTVEDRIYRFRCVEAWSMVVPWAGVPLAAVLRQLKPTSKAKYVEFTTLKRPSEMRGQRSAFSGIDWPYVEGLRMDEAMHPLTLMATGVYGKPLPNQNGAPWRLVVPWKYGFKSIKSIVKIRFTERKPKNTWNLLAPREYGFYANVNPAVPHPRWSQASERLLPSSLFRPNRRDTLPFNGYAEQVAGLYAGMDLTKKF